MKLKETVTPPTPEQIMLAHQLLYYNGRAVWSDYKYDQFCEHHKMNGSGGGGRPEDYAPEVQALAIKIEINPHLF